MKKTIVLLLLLNIAYAITLTPLTETLDSKKKKYLIFKVKNPTAEPVAVDVSVLRVLSTDNNREKREPTDKISYYPSQFVLSPKDTKNIRIRYMGSKLPDIEEVYRVIAKELDIDVSDKKEDDSISEVRAKIKMRFTYEGLLLVHNPTSKPELKITSFKELPNRELSISITNNGTASIVPMARNYNFLVTIRGKEYLLQPEDLKGAEFRRALPRQTNTYYLKHIVNLPNGKIDSIRLERIKK